MPLSREAGDGGTYPDQLGGLRKEESSRRTFDVTPDGNIRFESLRDRLSKMLWAGASYRGHRRGATRHDVRDFDETFADITRPAGLPIWLAIMTEVGGVIATLFVAYGVNVYTGRTEATRLADWILPGLGGVFLWVFCILLKYLRRP